MNFESAWSISFSLTDSPFARGSSASYRYSYPSNWSITNTFSRVLLDSSTSGSAFAETRMASSIALERECSLSERSIVWFFRELEDAIVIREGRAFMSARMLKEPECSIPSMTAFLMSKSHLEIEGIDPERVASYSSLGDGTYEYFFQTTFSSWFFCSFG